MTSFGIKSVGMVHDYSRRQFLRRRLSAAQSQAVHEQAGIDNECCLWRLNIQSVNRLGD
jgi:hypothetical protein